MSYATWLLLRHAVFARAMALLSCCYHVLRAAHMDVAGDELRGALRDAIREHGASSSSGSGGATTVVVFDTWREAQPLFRPLVGSWHQLCVEVPCALLILALLSAAAARRAPRLVAAAPAALLAAHVAHLAWAGVVEAVLLGAAAPPGTGALRVVWPMPLSWLAAYGTLVGHLCWPLPARAALPLLALRAALPLTRVWPEAPPAGLALQLGACAAAAAMVRVRDAALRPRYEAHCRAAAAAAKAKDE
jgi:hypothetical protein